MFLCDASVAVQFQGLFLHSDSAKGPVKQCGSLADHLAVKVSGAGSVPWYRHQCGCSSLEARSTCASSDQALGLCAFEHRVSPRLAHLQESVKDKARLAKESHRDITREIFMVIQWLCRGNFAH